MNDRFRLLVFDWDGTLMDSEARIVNCMRSAIQELEAAPRSAEQIRNIIGLGLKEAIRTLYSDAEDSFIEQLVLVYRRYFLELDDTPSTLFKGAREVLTRLAHQGYLLAIATGKARSGLDKVLQASALADLFDSSRCADETYSKPHPQMLYDIVTDLNVKPRDTLMIGDTVYDMEMSRNAGTSALAVTYGVHDLARLLREDPLGYIDDIQKLPHWLEENTSIY